MSSSHSGHVCLIANCYGSSNASGSPISDGHSYNGSTTADLASLVLTDAHVAQHNIFAATMSMKKQKHLSFPFNAVAAVSKGEEKVVLEILKVAGDAALTKGDLSFLHKGPLPGSAVTRLQGAPKGIRDRRIPRRTGQARSAGGPCRTSGPVEHPVKPAPTNRSAVSTPSTSSRKDLGPRAGGNSPSGRRHLTVFRTDLFRLLPRPC